MTNWDDMRIFLALVEAGDPAEAARQIRVNRTTVIRRVQRLESSLKAKLVEKRHGRYLASAEGRKLVEATSAIASIVERAELAVEATVEKVQGLVRVGAPDGLGSFYLAPRLAHLTERHPGLKVEINTKSREFDLARDGADIAITLAPRESGEQYVHRLDDLSLRLYASRDYLASRPPIRTIADLRGVRFIGYPDGFDFGADQQAKLADHGVLLDMPFASGNIVAQLRAVEAGIGVGLFPAYIARAGQNLEPVLKDELNVPVSLWLVVHRDLAGLARTSAVVRDIIQGFHEDRWLNSHSA